MIRPMVEGDIPTLIDMGERFYKESPEYKLYPFSKEKLHRLGYQILNDIDYICLVYDKGGIKGMLAGALYEQFFSYGRLASELFIFVDQNARGAVAGKRLIQAFEMWANSKGATEIRVGVSSGITPDRTVGFYERLGYYHTAIQLRKVF